MKFTSNIFLIALSVFSLWIVSCDEYRDANELDDQLYLQKTGLTEMKVFNWGTFTYELPVIKSGKGNHSATVKLLVDESVLTAYNEANGTDYRMMPENCYSLREGSLSFTEDDYRKYFLIDFDPQTLTGLEADGIQYVLACSMTTDNAGIQLAGEDKANILIKPSVHQPYIGFETPNIYRTGSEFSIKTDDDDLLVIYPKVQVNYYNEWDISYEVEVNSAALDAYNQNQGAGARTYKLLPEDAYSIDHSTCVLKKNRDYEYLQITLQEKAFKIDDDNYAFGYYALPLKISSVSKHGIDPNANVTIYPISIQPPVMDKGNWIIENCNSVITDEVENASSMDIPATLLDNNNNTFWSTRAIEPIEFPYYVTINLQESCKLYRLGFQLPQNAQLGNIKSGYFEVSGDGEQWVKVVDWNRRSNSEDRSLELDFSMQHANYIRFVITDAFEYADPAVGKSSGAVCQVAEINGWGI